MITHFHTVITHTYTDVMEPPTRIAGIQEASEASDDASEVVLTRKKSKRGSVCVCMCVYIYMCVCAYGKENLVLLCIPPSYILTYDMLTHTGSRRPTRGGPPRRSTGMR
jgi:hypothetical protein